MATEARVVVVGGGVVGCSVLYHLVERGWTDVVLCERTDLTAGSTWHAAGHVITYATDPTICRLNEYGARLYAELEARTGQSPGYHRCGNLRLATHPDRLDEFRRFAGIAEVTGIRTLLLTPAAVGELWPYVEQEGLLGGLYTPDDGHIAPSDLTQALAAGARQGGATIQRQTEVRGFTERRGGWRVHTSRGDIDCEHVVSCTGNYSRQTLALIGAPAHTVSLTHQYLVTGPIPELAERRLLGLPEMPVMRDPEESYYVRQEADGLVVGAYEGRGRSVFMNGVPASFGMQLFGREIDTLLPYVLRAAERVPLIGSAEIRSVVNGPQPYSPDDRPITGPVPGRRNFWLGEGNPFGVTLAGGVGWQLANWIVDGEPSIDMWSCDPRRFGSHATRTYSARKTEEAYERTYHVPKPDEEMEAARPLKTTPIHDVLAGRGAVFGEVYGWERPNWFAPAGVEPVERYSYHEPGYAPQIHRECAAIRSGLVVADLSHGATFEVSGDGAKDLLERLTTSPMPGPGRLVDAWVTIGRGTIRSSFEVFGRAPDDYILAGHPAAEQYDLDLLVAAARDVPTVRVANLTGREGCLLVSGDEAPALLARLSKADIADLEAERFDDVAFPVGAGRQVTIGYAPVRAVRTDTFGSLAWRLYTGFEFLRYLLLAILAEEERITLVGARSLDAMRFERGLPSWGHELTADTTPDAGGFSRLEVDDPRSSFPFGAPGREIRRRLCTLSLVAAVPSTLTAHQPVHDGSGAYVGYVTSAGIDREAGRVVAFAYLDDAAVTGSALTVQVLADRYPVVARIFTRPQEVRPE